jgi:addiction module HigA family antidote
MIITKRKPVSVGEMINEEFIAPLGITQGQLSSAMGVSRRTVNELCTGKRSITVDTALMLAKVFGNTAHFWLNLQQRNDIWAALHSPKRMEKIERVSPTREAIAQQGVPVDAIIFDKLSEANIGELILYYEILTSLTGSILNINTYNQPGVELGKRILADKFKK